MRERLVALTFALLLFSTCAMAQARAPLTPIQDFCTAAAAGNLPAVSFLRGSEVTDGHPVYSHPLAEQGYLVTVLQSLQQLSRWCCQTMVGRY